MLFSDLIFFLLIALSAVSAAANSIHGCGGFVEASPALIRARKPSDGKLDYSNIVVELLTVDGLVKDRTQCAPNGYYFIPVYDKGSFVIRLRGPHGWSWEPDNASVVVDQNGCNSNADINFRFTGFTISGKVRGAVGGNSCYLKDGGPSNVKVDLLSESGNHITSAFTSATGTYSFTNIIPGRYTLHASHPDLVIEGKGSSEVVLGFGNADVTDVFFATGYDIRGYVVAQGNPILGVQIFLYSDDILEVHCPQGVGSPPGLKTALCHAASDANGKFTFSSLPCGVYELIPFYKGENTVFDVSPASMTVSVEHRHITISQKFQVTGFSIGGRVVDDNGDGVEGVKIMLDGQQRAITDAKGLYKLDQVQSKHYTISAEKDHYRFNTLKNYLVLPNMASVDDIKAVSYDICGVVRILSDSKAKVALTHGPENAQPQMKLTDKDGHFCFEVSAGEYRLSALPIKSESSSGLLFSPPYIDVNVKCPLFNIEFSQAQVNILGKVICKEKCDPTVSITLSRVGEGAKKVKTVTLSHESNNFVFSKVFPGKYRLEVKHALLLEVPSEDSWCWQQNAIELDVGTEDIKDVVFVQKGYWVNIISTHETDSFLKLPDSTRVDLIIKKGSQRICVESAGKYELHFASSCISFGSSSLIFDTSDSSPLHLTGEKYLLKGEIHFNSSSGLDASDLSERVIVDVLNRERSIIHTVQTKLVSSSNNVAAAYEYSIWSALGEEFIFIPRDLSDNRGKKILFYPRERHVYVATDGCQPITSPIIGRVGLYLEGSVSPTISGVNIKVLATERSSTAPLHKGDLAVETETGPDGSFFAGPLYDDTSYRIEASKPGYHLKQVGPYSFSCEKLGQIHVHIKDGGQEDRMFPPVLLSLSGDDGYRNNTISAAGGTFVFDNLFPGSFYLRPLLKEYAFSPAAVAIELESGESKNVVFRATRVAYSAMGTVSLLTGQPMEGVYIAARSDSKGYYEEAITDNLGNFRLRGLQPSTKYVIRVVTKENHGVNSIERASPEYLDVEVGTEDVKGIDFVVFEKPKVTILSGHAEGTDLHDLRAHLSVEIKSASDPTKVEAVFPLPLSHYFEVRDLPKGKHLVQLRLGLPASSHIFESDILEVDLGEKPQVHVGPLGYKLDKYHHKQEPTPAPVFPLIVGVSVIALFISMPRLQEMLQMAVGMTSSNQPQTTSKREARRPVLRKRAY